MYCVDYQRVFGAFSLNRIPDPNGMHENTLILMPGCATPKA